MKYEALEKLIEKAKDGLELGEKLSDITGIGELIIAQQISSQVCQIGNHIKNIDADISSVHLPDFNYREYTVGEIFGVTDKVKILEEQLHDMRRARESITNTVQDLREIEEYIEDLKPSLAAIREYFDKNQDKFEESPFGDDELSMVLKTDIVLNVEKCVSGNSATGPSTESRAISTLNKIKKLIGDLEYRSRDLDEKIPFAEAFVEIAKNSRDKHESTSSGWSSGLRSKIKEIIVISVNAIVKIGEPNGHPTIILNGGKF